jgi:hypothetical protein
MSTVRWIVVKDPDVDPIDMAVWGVKDTSTGQIVVHFDTHEAALLQADYRNGSDP